MNSSRATKRKLASVNATAIGTAQNLSNFDTVSTEGLSKTFGLFYPASGEIYFCCTVSWREPPYTLSDINVSVTQ